MRLTATAGQLAALYLLMKFVLLLRAFCLAGLILSLAGCGSALAPIPATPAAAVGSSPDARALLDACVLAHGGAAAYGRLHDVNVRLSSHWAPVGPRLQPVLADTNYRQGSEERYLAVSGGWIVGQDHHGPKGRKHVLRVPPDKIVVHYDGSPTPSADPEVNAAAALVTDAYSMFLFGPEFFRRRGAELQRLTAAGEVDGHACDELLAVLRPGFGLSAEDRAILFLDRRTHFLLRVQFTLNALASTRGAEVRVDFTGHQKLAGVVFPTAFYEHIERPVSLDAHRWQILGFDVNRGYRAADLALPGTSAIFGGKAAAPARTW